MPWPSQTAPVNHKVSERQCSTPNILTKEVLVSARCSFEIISCLCRVFLQHCCFAQKVNKVTFDLVLSKRVCMMSSLDERTLVQFWWTELKCPVCGLSSHSLINLVTLIIFYWLTYGSGRGGQGGGPQPECSRFNAHGLLKYWWEQ